MKPKTFNILTKMYALVVTMIIMFLFAEGLSIIIGDNFTHEETAISLPPVIFDCDSIII